MEYRYGTGFDDLSCWLDVSLCKKALSVKKCLVFKCSLCVKKKKKKKKIYNSKRPELKVQKAKLVTQFD